MSESPLSEPTPTPVVKQYDSKPIDFDQARRGILQLANARFGHLREVVVD